MQKEALRYIQNAKENLGRSPIEDDQYLDDKYVKTACGVAYLGVLKAIDEYLLRKGLSKKELPKKVEERKGLHRKAEAVDSSLLPRIHPPAGVVFPGIPYPE